MRILVVSNLYPPVVFGGYEILCAQVVEWMRARGHRVEVVASRHGADRAAADATVHRCLELTTDFPTPGQDVGRVDLRLSALHRTAARNRRRLDAHLDRFGPDVVFCWSLNRLGLAPVVAAQAHGVPVCWSVNDQHPRQFRSAALCPPADPSGPAGPTHRARRAARLAAERWLWPLATFACVRPFPVVTISHALKLALVAAGLPLSHARVMHQGVRLDRFRFAPRRRAPGEPLRVLYAGQLSQAKGVHTLLAAVGGMAGACGRVEVTVAGSGVPAYEDHLRRLAGGQRTGARVVFAGPVAHGAMPELYHSHHVLVFPSEWEEPFGLSHLEAMACGCAVVSTTTGGSAELIRHGDNALAFEAGCAHDLAARLQRLAADEGLRQALIVGGREWVTNHHDFERYAGSLQDQLRAVSMDSPVHRGASSRRVPVPATLAARPP